MFLAVWEFVSYALWADRAAQFVVVDHVGEVSKQLHGTRRLCILKAAFLTLERETQVALLAAAKTSFDSVYVGFDTVPENLRLYVKWGPEHPVLLSNSTVFTREIVQADLNLYPRRIVEGGWFYWCPSESRTGMFRLGMRLCTDYQNVVKQYIWIFGRWVRVGKPSWMHGDAGAEVWKTLPEWSAEAKHSHDAQQGVLPLPRDPQTGPSEGAH